MILALMYFWLKMLLRVMALLPASMALKALNILRAVLLTIRFTVIVRLILFVVWRATIAYLVARVLTNYLAVMVRKIFLMSLEAWMLL